MVRRKFSRYQF